MKTTAYPGPMPLWIKILVALPLVGYLLVLLLGCGRIVSHPLGEWAPVGSFPAVKVVNLLDVTCTVVAETKDGQIRQLGQVAASDSSIFRIPFADQDVRFTVCHVQTILNIDSPSTWRLAIRYKTQ